MPEPEFGIESEYLKLPQLQIDREGDLHILWDLAAPVSQVNPTLRIVRSLFEERPSVAKRMRVKQAAFWHVLE
jgi:hypothetical protein